MNWQAIESVATALSAIFTALGVLFVGWQIWRTRRQDITAFEDEMSRQYRDILKTIPINALLGEELSKEEFCESRERYFSLSRLIQ